MSDTVIEVENLCKKYIIGHQKQERYTALRDVIADGARSFWRSLSGGGSGIPENKEEFWALKDVSFEVKQGECIGIIGRNGAGKSTLLKILSRITEPTTGRIKIKGRVASLLEVGTGFHPELTGRENIFLNGSILGMSRAEIKLKFDEIVDFAEVEKFLDTPVKFYSSGMYVRLAFAVAAHLEPEILVVDEVLAVGDAAFQKKCLGKMGDVAEKEGRTVLFVSHNMAVVHNLCKSGFLLSSGQIVESGSIKTVISEYTKKMERSSAEIQWSQENRPGNKRVKLIAARIISENQVKERVDISKEITIEIILENLKHDSLFYTSIHLKDNHGNCILASVNFPSGTLIKDDLACQTLSLGELVSKCTLPKNFLNDSTYYVSILVLRHDMSVEILCEDLLQFTVIDTGEMRKEFSGHWIGFIRPKLLWQTNYL